MTTTYNAVKARFDVESLPDYEGVSRRFLGDFQAFVAAKKDQAVQRYLKDELPEGSGLTQDPDFVAAVVRNLDEEGLLEKPYIFISINPEARF